jgi:hypothetical protein
MCSIVYDTTIYDRNTVDMKWVFYGPFTIVIITLTVGYVNVNDCILSFTIVVSIDLGKLRNFMEDLRACEQDVSKKNLIKLFGIWFS